MKSPPLHRALAAALVIALLAAPLPAAAQEAAKKDAPPAAGEVPPGRATIVGWIRDEQGEDLPGARFILAPLEGQSALISEVSDRFGEFKLRQLSYGYYRYGVETAAGIYLGSRILLVPPDRLVEIEIDLSPFLPEDEKLGLSKTDPVPGTDRIPIGVARLFEDTGPKGLAWFQTGKGVAVVVGAGVLLVGAVIVLTDTSSEETSASPSSPSRR